MESSNWKTKIVVGDVVKILLYYASRKVSEYIYTSENDAEQEARECKRTDQFHNMKNSYRYQVFPALNWLS